MSRPERVPCTACGRKPQGRECLDLSALDGEDLIARACAASYYTAKEAWTELGRRELSADQLWAVAIGSQSKQIRSEAALRLAKSGQATAAQLAECIKHVKSAYKQLLKAAYQEGVS